MKPAVFRKTFTQTLLSCGTVSIQDGNHYRSALPSRSQVLSCCGCGEQMLFQVNSLGASCGCGLTEGNVMTRPWAICNRLAGPACRLLGRQAHVPPF
jgi:hypothetical protein